MSTKLYVGNLPYSTMDQQLLEAFAEFGNVVTANVVLDRATGQSRGFGFVEFSTEDEAQRAIDSMNGADLGGRRINVNIARERSPRPGRGFGGGGGGGGFDSGGKNGRRPPRGGRRRRDFDR